MHLTQRFVVKFPAPLTLEGADKRILISLFLGHITLFFAWISFLFQLPTLLIILCTFIFYIALRFFIASPLSYLVARLLLLRILISLFAILSYGLIAGYYELRLEQEINTRLWHLGAYLLAGLSLYDMYWCYKGFPGFTPLKVIQFYINLVHTKKEEQLKDKK